MCFLDLKNPFCSHFFAADERLYYIWVGFLPPDEQWWFSSIMTQFGLYLILFALQLWFQVIVMDTYVLTKIVEKVPILRKLVILMQDHPILKYVLVSIMYFFALPDRKIR